VVERSFDDWYVEQHPRLMSTLVLLCGDEWLAAEATDEAFVRALERWDRVSQMASPGGWTYRTALNVVRRSKRRDALERRLVSRLAPSANLPPAWDPDVVGALSRLPPRQRLAVVLHHVADLTVADTAVAMDVRPGTVMATLHAGRANLARMLVEIQVQLTEETDGRS
jgi:RNA polymerase sigma-70 factor, ECF subfamily